MKLLVMLMDESKLGKLNNISAEIRKDILRMVGVARSGPLKTSLSTANLLVYLYWEEMLFVPEEPEREDRDRFMTDIPEAVPALYAVLARRGFFEREHLWHYRRLGAALQALPDFRRVPGVDAPCSAVRPQIAMAGVLARELFSGGNSSRVIFLTDEKNLLCDEFAGDLAKSAGKYTPNLLVSVLQNSSAAGKSVILETLASSGWDVRKAAFSDFASLEDAFASFDFASGAPKALIALPENVLPRPERTESSASLSMGELDMALEELEERTVEI